MGLLFFRGIEAMLWVGLRVGGAQLAEGDRSGLRCEMGEVFLWLSNEGWPGLVVGGLVWKELNLESERE